MTMGIWLFSYVAICFLGIGLMDSGVYQTPRYMIKKREQKAVLKCDPIKGHRYIYWYQQYLEEELQFLVYLQDDQVLESSQLFQNRLSVKWPKNSLCSLTFDSPEKGDSAIYFCASSEATGIQHNHPALHEWDPHRKRLMNAGVTQIPRHLIKGKGQEMTLMCKQDLGHDAIFWYQQDANREIRVMFYFSKQELITNETASSRFQSGFHKEQFNLKIELLQLEDTAKYFCASSKPQSCKVP